MNISKEERVEMRRKEIVRAATGLFYRFMEDRLALNELTKELGRMDEGTRAG